MVNLSLKGAKKLIVQSEYDRIFTEKVKSNGGNSGKISCKSELIGKEALIFILKNKKQNE